LARGATSIRASIALAAVALAFAGCGGRDNPDLANGKAMFTQKCGSCHVLERAGTAGKTGPDLDRAFGPARRDGFGASTVEGVVSDQIANPLPGTGMPANLVTGEDRRDVSAYVAAVAGIPGEDTGALAQAGLAGATTGRQIYVAAGCGACHTFGPAGTNASVGPPLDDLAQRAAQMKPAEQFVEESIVKPDEVVAKGFQAGTMPDNFGERLEPKQIDALVKFLMKQGQ
jgi:cytochrome c2